MDFSIVYFILISLSVSHVWNFSDFFIGFRKFFAKIKPIRKLITCPVCNSFWIGLLVSLLYNPLIGQTTVPFVSHLFLGLLSYFFAVIAFPLINKDGFSEKIDLKGKKLKTTISEWNSFYTNICKTGNFNTFSVVKEGDDLIVFFC